MTSGRINSLTGLRAVAAFAAAWLAIAVAPSFAQQGFFGDEPLFSPEISWLPTGALLDAQATVSNDRKYVTITTGGSNYRLRSLQTFPVFSTATGFVGGANPEGDPMNAAPAWAAPVAPAPGHQPPPAPLLNRRGVYLVRPITPAATPSASAAPAMPL